MVWRTGLQNKNILYTKYNSEFWKELRKSVNMEKILIEAMGKVNLGLDVLRRREDGYHEVRMVMQTVDLCDDLLFERTKKPGIEIETDRAGIPVDGRNLVYKAADLLMKRFEVTDGLRVKLRKRIPIAAGMAGGSTDAAAAFVAVNELFELGLGKRELMELAVQVGADVPYCILGGTALAEGIGERLTGLPDAPECTLLIARPDIAVSTKFVYGNLHLDTLERHPDIDGMLKAVYEQDLDAMAARLGNVLESVTVREYPVIEKLKHWMKENGAVNALMSGSGPTVFGIYREKREAQKACVLLRESGLAGLVETAELVEGNRVSRL